MPENKMTTGSKGVPLADPRKLSSLEVTALTKLRDLFAPNRERDERARIARFFSPVPILGAGFMYIRPESRCYLLIAN